MPQIVFLNGQLLTEGLPSWFTHLGVGIFDTMSVKKHGKEIWILGYHLHLKRLLNGAETIQAQNFSRKTIENGIASAISCFDWKLCDFARLRVIILENDWIVTLQPWSLTHDCKSGIETISYHAERSVPEIKSCSAISSFLARKEAFAKNAGEAFLIDRDGVLREGSWSNFFWVNKDGVVTTPQNDVLKGVTRNIVLSLSKETHQTKERDATLKEILLNAQEAFMTQTSHGIIPVTSIDGSLIGSGKPGPITLGLIKNYQDFEHRGEEPFTKRIMLNND